MKKAIIVGATSGIGKELARLLVKTGAHLSNYLRALRQKAGYLKLPITITDIRPGFVDTDRTKGDGLFWLAPLEKASRQIFNALLQKKRVICVTKRWALVVWILRRIPNFIYNRM